MRNLDIITPQQAESHIHKAWFRKELREYLKHNKIDWVRFINTSKWKKNEVTIHLRMVYGREIACPLYKKTDEPVYNCSFTKAFCDTLWLRVADWFIDPWCLLWHEIEWDDGIDKSKLLELVIRKSRKRWIPYVRDNSIALFLLHKYRQWQL